MTFTYFVLPWVVDALASRFYVSTSQYNSLQPSAMTPFPAGLRTASVVVNSVTNTKDYYVSMYAAVYKCDEDD